jgi:GNAT superfamily N-acetyltransferase
MAEVRVLRPTDAAAAAAILARGFDEEPAKVSLAPDPEARRAVLELSASNRLYDATRRGTAHAAVVAGETAAVAVWIPPGTAHVSLTGGVLAAAGAVRSASRMRPVLRHATSLMVRDLPGLIRTARWRKRAVALASHGQAWYLALLATLPEYRGRGLARALLERQLRRCDEDDAAAWLETTDPVNPPIYQRFGFEHVAHTAGPAWLPGLWVMRREPRRA